LVEHPMAEWWQFLPLIDRVRLRQTLDHSLLMSDERRLQQYFRRWGYLDAQVELEVLSPQPRRSTKAAGGREQRRRHARFSVELGEAWRIDKVALDWPEDLDPELASELSSAVNMRPGAYRGARVDRTLQRMRDVLHGRGQARSEPSVMFVPSGDHTGELRFDVFIDAPVTVGPVAVLGADRVNGDRLARRLGLAWPEGSAFDGVAMRRVQRRLGRLDAFERVSLSQDLDVPGEAVPVQVQLQERPRREVRVSVKGNTVGGFYALGVGPAWNARHLMGSLASASGRTVVGYMLHPRPENGPGGDQGLLLEHEVRFDVPLAPLRGLVFEAENRADLLVETGYHAAGLAAWMGLSLQPTDPVKLSAQYHMDAWWFFPFSGQDTRFDLVFARDGPDDPDNPALQRRYVVHYPTLVVESDTRNDPKVPTHGAVAHLEIAPVMFEQGDRWFRAQGEIRGYVPVARNTVVFAGRFAGGLLQRWNQKPHAGLLGHRFFLGGGTDLRGWSRRRAAPPGFLGNVRQVQSGGNVMLLGSVETRVRVFRGIWNTVFFDVGRVWAYLLDQPEADVLGLSRGVHLSDLQPTVGTGAHLPTPAGMLRAELAFRLLEVTDIADPGPRITFHLGFSPAF